MQKNLGRSVREYQLTIKTIYHIDIPLQEIMDAYEIIKYENDL